MMNQPQSNESRRLRIALRVNASSTIQHIATGHLMRCGRLASELMGRGHEVTLWTNDDPLFDKLADESIPRQTVGNFKEIHPRSVDLSELDVLVIDMPDEPYTEANDPAFLKELSDAGVSLIKLGHTGFVSRHYSAVISLYPTREIWTSNYYEGADYLVLDRRFLKLRPSGVREETDRVEEVFVCMGGTDLEDESSRALRALAAAGYEGHVTVALGSGNPNLQRVKETVQEIGLDADVHHASTRIEELMAPAQMAITAFGTTAYELMGLGIPSVSITHKSWQTPSAAAFGRLNTTLFAGEISEISDGELSSSIQSLLEDSGRRKAITEAALSMVDFRGVERVADIVEQSVRPRKPLDHLYILAHPGDEAFACAGTILAQTRAGQSVGLVILSDGYLARRDEGKDASWEQDQAKAVTGVLQSSVAHLGISAVYYYKLPDNEFDRVPFLDIVKLVEQVIAWHGPRNLYTNLPQDMNIDHQLTSKAVATAARPHSESSVEKLFYVELPCSTDWGAPLHGKGFQPNWFEDVSGSLDAKLEAVALYRHELRSDPHPRSVDAIAERARHWGRMAGFKAAEAFELVRARNSKPDRKP